LRCNAIVTTSSVPGREAFERAIVRGNEQLREGNVAEAQRAFLAALEHDADNVRALALLGLSYFRANQFGEAHAIYQDLCGRLPNDASHHLNLGLVRLKLGDTEGAIEALEASRRLDPSQGRAVNYLGLAYARAGRYADAYEAFLIADQGDLALEIEPNLSPTERAAVLTRVRGSADPDPFDSDAFEAFDRPGTPTPAPPGPVERRTERSIGIGGAIRRPATPTPARTLAASSPAVAPAKAAAAPASSKLARDPRTSDGAPELPATAGAITRAVAVADAATSGRDAATRVSTGNSPPMALSELAMSALVRPDDGDHPFEVGASGALLVRVTDRMFCRRSGVYATGGQLDFEAAHRRSRGANTEELFDHGGDPLSVVSGQGYLVAFPDRGRFVAVYLDDDILYLREEKVFAFSATLRWENGNIPGLRGRIPVVQFRGDGAVAFRSVRTITPIKLAAASTMFVEASALAGWIGRVIPRAVMPATGGPMEDVCVECTGEGVVLVESRSAPDGDPGVHRSDPAGESRARSQGGATHQAASAPDRRQAAPHGHAHAAAAGADPS
jgi:hypothetical protein